MLGPDADGDRTAAAPQQPRVVAMVAQRYRLSLVPARPAEVEAAVTLRPRAPMLMRVDRAA